MKENFKSAQLNQIALAGKDKKFLKLLSPNFRESIFRNVRIKFKEDEISDVMKIEFIEFLNKYKPNFDIKKVNLGMHDNNFKQLYDLSKIITPIPDEIYTFKNEVISFLTKLDTKKFDISKIIKYFDFKTQEGFENFLISKNLSEKFGIDIKKFKNIKSEPLHIVHTFNDKESIDYFLENYKSFKAEEALNLIPLFIKENLSFDVLKEYNADTAKFLKFAYMHYGDYDNIIKIYDKEILDVIVEKFNDRTIEQIDNIFDEIDFVLNFEKTHDKNNLEKLLEFLSQTDLPAKDFESLIKDYSIKEIKLFSIALTEGFENTEIFLSKKLDLKTKIDILDTVYANIDFTDCSKLFNEDHTKEQIKTIKKLIKKGFKDFDTNPKLSPDEMYAKCYLDKWGIKVEDNFYKTFIEYQKRDIEGLLRIADTIPNLLKNEAHIIIEYLYKNGIDDIYKNFDKISSYDIVNKTKTLDDILKQNKDTNKTNKDLDDFNER